MATSTMRYEELPFWMRRAMRRTDWGVLLVLGFCMAASLPFFFTSALPIGTAHERYAYRAAEIAESIGEGRWYPRWTDEALGGYGAPIPQFMPPLAGYVPALLDITLVDDPGTAVSITFVLAACLAGTTLYAFVARRAGAVFGVAAAILYIFNPWIGVVIPQQLGDLQLALGAALLPALLWAVDGLIQRRAPRDLAAGVTLSAGLLLLDVRFAAAGLAGAMLLVAVSRLQGRRLPWLRLLVVLLLGIAMASLYWLPALLESAGVRWYAAEIAPDNQVRLATLFTPVIGVDSAAMIVPPHISLGILPPLALLSALMIFARRAVPQRLMYFATAITGAGLIGAAVAVGNQLWLLVPAALCFAIAGASLIELRTWLPLPLRRVFPVAICAVIVGVALQPWIAAATGLSMTRIDRDFSSDAAISFEQRGYGVAILPPGSATPATIPPDYVFSTEAVRSQVNSAGGEWSIVSGRAQIGLLSDSAHDLRLQVQVFSPTTLELFTAPFPGWTAWLGNQPVELHSNPDQPLLHIDLQEGQRGELSLTLGSTPLRLISWIMTWLASAATVLLVLRWRGRGDREGNASEFLLLDHAEVRLLAVLLSAIVGIFAIAFGLPDFANAAGWQPTAGAGMADVQPLNIRSDAGLELIGYQFNDGRLAPGSTLAVTLYWRTLRPVEANYRAQIAFQDRSTGRVDSLSAVRHPGDLPTRRWLPRRYVVDSWRIPIPDSLSPGDYGLVLALFACDTRCQQRQAVMLFGADGVPLGPVLTLPFSTTIVSD